MNTISSVLPALLPILALSACATEYSGSDVPVDGRDVPSDESTAGDEGSVDVVPDDTDTGTEVVPDVAPDVAADTAPDTAPDTTPDVAPDVPVDVVPEVPLPVSCERTGAQDCSAFSEPGRCPDGPTTFGSDVNAGIDAAIAGHPEWFVTDGYPGCCPLIQPANVNDYMQAVTDYLAGVGLCASGPGEELGVKYNNECSESWDLVANPDAETNLVRRHYVGCCFPSFF
jgi:hypothetical protein